MMKALIIENALKFTPSGDIIFGFSPAINDKRFLPQIIDRLYELLLKLKCDTVLGHGYGGAQLCGAIVSRYPEFNSIVVRNEVHKNNQQVEGSFKNASRIAFIDDAIFKGRTFEKVKAVLSDDEFQKIVGAVVVYDDWSHYGTRRLEQQYQLPVISAVSRREIGLSRDADLNLPPEIYERALIQQRSLTAKRLLLSDYSSRNESIWEMKSSPVFYGDVLITATDQYQIAGYKLDTAEVIWEHQLPHGETPSGKGVVQELTVSPDGFMYIGSFGGTVTKLEPMTGLAVWETKLDMFIHATPVYHDGKLYVNTESFEHDTQKAGGSLFCVDALTGKPIWRHVHQHHAPATVTVHGGKVYATVNDKTFCCFDLDGALCWSIETQREVKLPAMVIDDHLFLMDIDGWLHKHDMAGRLIWTVRANNSGWQCYPIVYQGMIISWSKLGNFIFGYDPTTGAKRWSAKLRAPTAGIVKLSEDDLLTVTSKTHLAYFHKTDKLWELNEVIPGAKLSSNVALNSNLTAIAFQLHTGGLQAYNIS